MFDIFRVRLSLICYLILLPPSPRFGRRYFGDGCIRWPTLVVRVVVLGHSRALCFIGCSGIGFPSGFCCLLPTNKYVVLFPFITGCAIWWFAPVFINLLSCFTGFEFLTHDFNFWSAFFCSWLVLPVIFITFTRLVSERFSFTFSMQVTWTFAQANIISCAVLGSYAVIIPIDHYIGSSLKYIIVNIVRRATIRGFGRTVLDPPYQDNGKAWAWKVFYLVMYWLFFVVFCHIIDLILTIAWVGLSVSGIVFQYVRERKRPPFSPPADMWRRTGYLSEQTPLISETVPNHYSAT